MKIRRENGLLYVSAMLAHDGKRLTLDNILLDTGSSGTVFSTNKMLELGLQYEQTDELWQV